MKFHSIIYIISHQASFPNYELYHMSKGSQKITTIIEFRVLCVLIDCKCPFFFLRIPHVSSSSPKSPGVSQYRASNPPCHTLATLWLSIHCSSHRVAVVHFPCWAQSKSWLPCIPCVTRRAAKGSVICHTPQSD